MGVEASTDRYGEDSWAVITGSDELGRASAMHLASLGFNIVLLGGNADKLKKVAQELQSVKTPSGKQTKTKIIVNDFSKHFDNKTFEDIYTKHLEDLDISILHNNVEVKLTGKFLDMSDDDVHNMIASNTYSAVLLTR